MGGYHCKSDAMMCGDAELRSCPGCCDS